MKLEVVYRNLMLFSPAMAVEAMASARRDLMNILTCFLILGEVMR